MLIPNDFLPCFRFTHLKNIQHGDSYERYMSGQKTVGTDGHSVADGTRESPAVCACLESGACEISRTGGPRWVFRARALRDKINIHSPTP